MPVSRRRAREYVEAAAAVTAGGSRPDLAGEDSALLGAVSFLKAADAVPRDVDPNFAASLRLDLVSRFDELVSDEMKEVKPSPALREGRKAWIAIPAAAAAAALIAIAAILLLRASAPAPADVARLSIEAGRVSVVRGGNSREVTGPAGLKVGDEVLTAGASRATITFNDGNVARLDGGTRLFLDVYDEKQVTLEQEGGRSYNRVVTGTDYTLTCRGVEVSAAGTAFDVESPGSQVDALAFQGNIRVKAPDSSLPSVVAEGNKAQVTFADGVVSIKTEPIDLASLDYWWLAYNRDLDRNAKFSLGVLGGLPDAPPPGTPPPPVAPEPPASSAPSPEPGPEPVPEPGPETKPEPKPEPKPSATLYLGDPGPPVYLKWETADLKYETVVVLRAEGGKDVVYPDSAIKEMSPPPENRFFDDTAYSGAAYTYMLAFTEGGKVILKSNPVTVETPPPTVIIGIDYLSDGMHIKWHIDGNVPGESWAVCKSEVNSKPSYPPGPNDEAWLVEFTKDGSFVDANVAASKTYYYRVAVVMGGKGKYYSDTARFPQ